jgi:hypothetical protein
VPSHANRGARQCADSELTSSTPTGNRVCRVVPRTGDPVLRAADGYGNRWTGPERGRTLHAYLELSRDDVVAALDYASAVMDEEVVALGAWRARTGSTACRQMSTWPQTHRDPR